MDLDGGKSNGFYYQRWYQTEQFEWTWTYAFIFSSLWLIKTNYHSTTSLSCDFLAENWAKIFDFIIRTSQVPKWLWKAGISQVSKVEHFNYFVHHAKTNFLSPKSKHRLPLLPIILSFYLFKFIKLSFFWNILKLE